MGLLVQGNLLKANRYRMLSWFVAAQQRWHVDADTDIDTNNFKRPSAILEVRLTTTSSSAYYQCLSLFASTGICRTKWLLCQQPGNILAPVTDDIWVISTKPYGRADQLCTPWWSWSCSRITMLPVLQSRFNIWLHNPTQCSTEVGTFVLVLCIADSMFSS